MEQMTELQDLECIYQELYKSVYGIKARWYRAASIEEARADIARLEEAYEQERVEEAAAQQRAITRFETLVQTVIASGAKDRETAIRWIHQASGTLDDNEYLCYVMGLPYHYFDKKS